MSLINETVLVTRNARDKIQVASFFLEQTGNTYTIKRLTGQFGGKMTQQPDKIIERGKAGRSVLIQAESEYNSLIKKSLDKGYKKLSNLTKTKFSDITQDELDEIVPTLKTDQQGELKPQLAKSSNDCTINVFDKPMFCSRKIDGVRCMMRYDEDKEEVISISRGGKEYDIPTTHIRKGLEKLFLENPGIILDGELYVHGWSLQKISGVCRKKSPDKESESLEYWIFDIVDSENSFTKRLDTLTDLDTEYNVANVKFVEHIYLEGWSSIKKYHDKFVAEGFEGLVARKPDKTYQPGKRNSDWIKVKDYLEEEFEIVGYEDGLRPEDFCFVMETRKGKKFKAKPVGTREDKEEYMNDMDNIIGNFGTVKFFAYSDDNIPIQPVFKSVKYDE